MKVLWITNMMLPPIAIACNRKVNVGGGWMYSSLKRLKNLREIELGVATVYDGAELIEKELDNVKYYLLPLRGKDRTQYNSILENYWRDINEKFNPDVVHIHGTEYPHGLAYVRATLSTNVVVSIQGLVSKYAEYYLGDITQMECLKNISLHDVLKNNSLFHQQKRFKKRGLSEIELLKNVSHIIGRTEWDKSNVWAINSQVRYHHCGETLRDEFYKHKWNYENCKPHTIFVSQAGYPIKGFHKLLDAIALVIPFYPDTHIYVPGANIIDLPWYKISSYGKYLKSKLKKLGIENHVTFLGPLSEGEMCNQFLKCNLFICPSIIENSPNSVGEAQLLGVPYLTSICGGTPQICGYNFNSLYRFEETASLAYKICDVFKAGQSYAPLPVDLSIYDGNQNLNQLLNIYNSITDGSK